MDNYAHQACIRCRKQKRKCNRLLPICSRCKKLDLSCRYHGILEDQAQSSLDSPLDALTPMPDVDQLSHTLQSHVSSIIGDKAAIAQSAATYFGTIHTWFPTVNRDAYYRSLLGSHSNPRPTVSLLTLCVYLLAMQPTDGMSRRMNGLYILVTGFVASLGAAGVNNLDLLQSRILLSLFEVGHGMYPAGYISMGANIRTAVAIGANLPSDQLTNRFVSLEAADDARRIWQGLVILDRYVSMEMENAPSISKEGYISFPDQTTLNELQDSTSFMKLYHASNLVDQVLAHVFNATPYEQKSAEAIPLLESLASFRGSLQNPEKSDLSYLATALCSSAFMTILEFGYLLNHPVGKDCSPLSFVLLEAEVQQFLKAGEEFTQVIAAGDAVNIPVFSVHSIGKAAIIILRYLRDSETVDVSSSLNCLTGLLELMNRRWLAAGVYLEKIQRESD
ncbi:hypothetical protein BDW59DRAFT_160940 [Aspergillus cavernicola]|uniref:Zn(2)-C6 fungal-type domain-containing protein n=1 Tax=Aspergillus cavernicola TaxID=176166 RepID=A0ABR4IF77_9EURO